MIYFIMYKGNIWLCFSSMVVEILDVKEWKVFGLWLKQIELDIMSMYGMDCRHQQIIICNSCVKTCITYALDGGILPEQIVVYNDM